MRRGPKSYVDALVHGDSMPTARSRFQFVVMTGMVTLKSDLSANSSTPRSSLFRACGAKLEAALLVHRIVWKT